MEDFLKKHNFDINKNNRLNRRFHIVRYYPKIQTYEFINVGIIVYDKNEVFYRLLQADEQSKLHCPSLIESKVLRNSLDSLDKYLQDQQSLNAVIEDISKRYKNILDTSFQLVYSGNEDAETLVNKLFYDYVGYKLEVEEKENKLDLLIEKTENIIVKDFKKSLKVKKSKIRGYNLEFLNTKTYHIHYSLLGSIENSENVARAFLNAPSDITNAIHYDFLNTKAQINKNGVENRLKLNKLQVGVFNYLNEDDIANYCNSILH